MSVVLRGTVALLVALSAAPAAAGKPSANKLPVVSLTSPVGSDTFTAPASIRFTASASDPNGSIARVDFYQGSTKVGSSSTSPYAATWANVPAGTYSLTAKAYDNQYASATSAAVTVTVGGTAGLISTPANGSVSYDRNVLLTGTFSGDPNTTTVLADNGSGTRVATLSGNTYSASLPIVSGPNTLTVVAARRDKTFETKSISVTGSGNPLVVLTSPSSMGPYAAPAAFELAADAVSPGGDTISKVDFFKNDAVLGTAVQVPYRIAVSGLAAGNYSFAARATDNRGRVGQATIYLSVEAPNVSPQVMLTSPLDGDYFDYSSTVTLQADASDSDGYITRVDFFRDDTLLGSDSFYPYSLTWSDVPVGSYALTAQAFDDRGGSTTSSAAQITVQPYGAYPAVELTAPSEGATYREPASIPLAAAASDSDGTVSKVEFYQGSELIGSSINPPYAFTWAGVAAGDYSLRAKAVDDSGRVSTSLPVNVSVSSNPPPTVSLTGPAPSSAYYAPARVHLQATAQDADGIDRLEFYQGGSLIHTAATSPYAYRWTGVPAGSYSLSAKAVDSLGAAATSQSVAIAVAEPQIVISSPADGAILAGDHVTVHGSIDAPFNSGVTVNGQVAALNKDNTFYAEIDLTAGSNSIEVTLHTQGGESYTRTLTVYADGLKPFLDVHPDKLEVIAPDKVVFNLTNRSSSKADVQVNGGTPFAMQPGATVAYTLTYSVPYDYDVTFSGTNLEGDQSTQSFKVVAHDPAVMDAKLSALWNGMHGAVKDGDVDWALTYLSVPAVETYGPVFQTLQADYAEITASFSALQRNALSLDVGEYAVNRTVDNVNRIFFIYYQRDSYGVWRLEGM